MIHKKKRSYYIGHWAEIYASLYLQLKGYTILKRRYKTPVGEIDILARKGKMLIATEVKYRSLSEHALETIHTKNQHRVTRSLAYFISQDPYYDSYDMRFDAIIISRIFIIQHLMNAWQSNA